MWAWTLIAATGMWARTLWAGRDLAGKDLAGTDVFLEMTASQKLDFNYRIRFVSRGTKKLVLFSLLYVLITIFLCKINYT
jgi:hypothetical protein